MKKKSGPPAVTVADADALTALEADNDVVVLGYFAKLAVSGGDWLDVEEHLPC